MKTLLITLLISFNCLAQTKITIVKANEATMSFEEPTLNKAVKRLKKIVLSKKRFKGSWSTDSEGSIFKRSLFTQPENTIIEDAMEVVGLEVEPKEFEYFIPSNFSVKIEDVTEIRQEEKAKKVKKEKNKKDLKDLLMKKDLNLTQINKLLREMI